MFSLGQIAYSGGDPGVAMTWFERASQKSHARSMYWMAKLFWRGHGVERDRHKAMKLIQGAASHRDPEARRFLRYLSWCEKRSKHGREPDAV
jgi:TPR repeat protein